MSWESSKTLLSDNAIDAQARMNVFFRSGNPFVMYFGLFIIICICVRLWRENGFQVLPESLFYDYFVLFIKHLAFSAVCKKTWNCSSIYSNLQLIHLHLPKVIFGTGFKWEKYALFGSCIQYVYTKQYWMRTSCKPSLKCHETAKHSVCKTSHLNCLFDVVCLAHQGLLKVMLFSV